MSLSGLRAPHPHSFMVKLNQKIHSGSSLTLFLPDILMDISHKTRSELVQNETPGTHLL